MDKLPENIVKIEQIRIERGLDKLCQCREKRYTLDTVNRRVTCRTCGAERDPFDCMYEMANDWERIHEEIEVVFAQRKALDKYKPHLRIIKELESKTRAGPNQMHPVCPACDEPFNLNELNRFYGAKFVNSRILERIDQKKKEEQKREE